MPVTPYIEVWHGAGPTETNVEALGPPNVRLKTNDDATIDLVDPVPIPAAGFNYSYWKHIAIAWDTIPTSLTNIRHYSDAAIGWNYGTSGELRRGNRDAGDHGCPKGSYDQATGTPGTTGDDLETHTYYAGQTTKTAALPEVTPGVVIDSTDYSAAEDSHAVVLQVKVDTDAVQGDQANETMTWLYDEI